MRRIRNATALSLVSCVTLCLVTTTVRAADHKVEPITEAPPASELAPAVAPLLGGPAFRVVRGESRVVCEVWLCKQWTIKGDLPKTGGDVIYPLQPGQLIGVVRYPRKASDFRDQDIAPGLYTLRYGQQPVDGAHVGTSPTRDFLLLLKASDDQDVAALDYKGLTKKSADAAGSNHPLLLSMQRLPESSATVAPPSIRHQEEHDWWIVRTEGQLKEGEKSRKLPVEVVFVGKAAE